MAEIICLLGCGTTIKGRANIQLCRKRREENEGEKNERGRVGGGLRRQIVPH